MNVIRANTLTCFGYVPTLNTMPEEIIIEIVKKCLRNKKDFIALRRTNHQFYKITQHILDGTIKHISPTNIFDLCPKLTFVSTIESVPQAQELSEAQELSFKSCCALLKAYNTLESLVEGDKGVSLLIMFKGTTMATLGQIAKDKKIILSTAIENILYYINDEPLPETYLLLITNNVIIDSRKKNANLQSEAAKKIEVDVATWQELFALCIFTNDQQDSQVSYKGTKPITMGRTSTLIQDNCSIAVGKCQPGFISVIPAAQDKTFSILGTAACRRIKL